MYNLSYYLISSLLGAIYTLLLGTSMALVYDNVGMRLFQRQEVWIRAMYFFCGLLVTSNIILVLGACSLASTGLLQVMGACFIISAIIIAYRTNLPAKLRTVLPSINRIQWFGYLILGCLLAQLFIALAPPTDADSLDYHLGVPVEILNRQSIWLNKDNLHFRMFGFGETLNVLGLANGCAQYGAFIQYISLLWFLYVFTSVVDNAHKKSALAIVLALPVFLFLLATQKHQLTGVACTGICFIAVHKYAHELKGKTLVLFIATLAMAAGLKYSFLISAFTIFVFLLMRVQNRMPVALSVLVWCFVFLSPLYIIKYIHYGDPVSPLLERYSHNPDMAVTILSNSIKTFKESTLPFPFGLIIPKSAGYISTILGAGTLLIFSVLMYARKNTAAVFVTFLFVVMTIVFGQTTSRFFIEPYLWAAIVIFTAPAMPAIIKQLIVLCRLQFLFVAPLFIVTAALLGRGILSNSQRDDVMNDYAAGYAESMWIDNILPKKAVICTNIRSRSLLPRKYFPLEYIKTIRYQPQVVDNMLQKKYRVDYLILTDNAPAALAKRYAGTLVAEKTFYKATRNPFNKQSYVLKVFTVRQ